MLSRILLHFTLQIYLCCSMSFIFYLSVILVLLLSMSVFKFSLLSKHFLCSCFEQIYQFSTVIILILIVLFSFFHYKRSNTVLRNQKSIGNCEFMLLYLWAGCHVIIRCSHINFKIMNHVADFFIHANHVLIFIHLK